jgi:hypothetical protein
MLLPLLVFGVVTTVILLLGFALLPPQLAIVAWALVYGPLGWQTKRYVMWKKHGWPAPWWIKHKASTEVSERSEK